MADIDAQLGAKANRNWPLLWANAAVAVAYIALGKFALLQALPPGYATIIFFPSGLALAALVRYGPGLLPGIALGAFLLNLNSSAAGALVVAAGTTVQGVVASLLFARWCTPALASARQVLAFLLLVPLACLVNASVSVAGLFALGVFNADNLLSNWIFWWAGDTVGVLVAAPLVWLMIGRPAGLWRSRRWLLGVPLCISSLAFILMFVRVSAMEAQQNRHQFVLNAQQLADIFQAQFGEHERLLYAMGSLYGQSHASTPESFARMARSYLDNRPELRLISWAPRVKASERAKFEQRAQAEVASDFVIRQFADGKPMPPSPPREQYFATVFLEPLAGNERVLGMDMLSEPLRAAMVRNALARKRPTASEPIKLVQKAHEYGILLAQMAYPDGDTSREASGMMVAVIEAQAYVRLALAQTAIAGLAVQLDDVTSPHHPLVLASQNPPPSELGQVQKPLTLGGRSYLLTVRPTEAYVRDHQQWQSWGALGSGMAMTGLLGAFLLLVSGQREEIENLVALRTRELREREARLQAILNQAGDAILTFGRDGKLLASNGAAERLFGYGPGGMQGLAFGALQAPDALPAIATLDELARHDHMVGGTDPAGDCHGLRADGSTFPMAMGASLVELPEESFFVCILHDLSEQRRAQQKILALEAFKQAQNDMRMAEKMAALGSLVAGIAHELNTPIGNSLLAATSLSANMAEFQQQLEQGAVKRSALQQHFAESEHACEMIAGSLHRVADLITTFKQVAVNQTIDQRRQFDLLGICQATLGTHASALQEAGCSVQINVPHGLVLRSYPGSVSQVLSSLVGNVLQHALPEQGGGRIDISARLLDADNVELVFQDNGIGMPPEILSRVFDPFFTTKLGQGSSGLGMNIVYNVVTGMLRGRITIDSALGEGTRVTVVMPINSGEPAEAGPPPAVLVQASQA